MNIYKKECLHQGVDPKKIASITRRIDKAMRELREMNLSVFGGTRALTIRGDNELILARVDGWVSGGDGAYCEDKNGLCRGEM